MKKNKPQIASCVAILPYSAAAHEAATRMGSLSAWARPSNFWPQRSVLKVGFIGGSARQKAETRVRFELVDSLTNLSFIFPASGPFDIRVAFDRNNGHWSYLGKGALSIPKNKPTMNLALMAGVLGDGSYEWDRVAIHEILHAIGFEHEHQNPKAVNLRWNKEAVYAYYGRTQGWSRQQIDFQVLNRPQVGNDFFGSTFDSTSIMEYPIPQGLANITVGWNDKLSKTDLDIIRMAYPAVENSKA